MAQKKKLLIQQEYDFFLFGISCSEKQYRLCWALNERLKASFMMAEPIMLKGKTDQDNARFPVFFFRDEENLTDLRLISNRQASKILVQEYRQADFLLLVQGGIPSAEKGNLLKKIKEVQFVQTAFEIDPKKIKSKDNFIF